MYPYKQPVVVACHIDRYIVPCQAVRSKAIAVLSGLACLGFRLRLFFR
jgi:hypothetical protein